MSTERDQALTDYDIAYRQLQVVVAGLGGDTKLEPDCVGALIDKACQCLQVLVLNSQFAADCCGEPDEPYLRLVE